MSETTEVLNQAAWEITRLRHENEILRAKESVINAFTAALTGQKIQMQNEAQAPDVLWTVQRHYDELIQTEKVTGRLSGLSAVGLAKLKLQEDLQRQQDAAMQASAGGVGV